MQRTCVDPRPKQGSQPLSLRVAGIMCQRVANAPKQNEGPSRALDSLARCPQERRPWKRREPYTGSRGQEFEPNYAPREFHNRRRLSAAPLRVTDRLNAGEIDYRGARRPERGWKAPPQSGKLIIALVDRTKASDDGLAHFSN